MRDEQREQARTNLARRGLLAAVAGLAAGGLAKATTTPALAGMDGDVVLNASNNGTNPTIIQVAVGVSFSGSEVFRTDARNDITGGTIGLRGFASNAGLGFSAGTGVIGIGGQGNANFTQGGVGVLGAGGFGAGASGAGAPGVSGNGGSGVAPNGNAAAGVEGFGGTASGSGAQGIGVRGTGNGPPGSQGSGVVGLTNSTPNAAVLGQNSGTGSGVLGQCNTGVGVHGSSNGNVGVLGVSNASHGLFGSSTNGYGLYATSTNNSGIVASTNGGNAIQGASNGNVGVLGTSNSSIGGFFSSGTATGLYGTGPAAGFAARFDGPVLVNGNFTAIGGSKSAAVPHPDGSHRRLYCVESPESWFEDFGTEQLVNGRARVRLDPDFDALVRGDNYQVFLTPEGDSKGLYVSGKNSHTFEVREQQGGTSSLGFSYRVVAKRKDIAGPRLERVDVPAAPLRPAAPVPPPAVPRLDPPRLDPPRFDPNAQTGERKPQ